MNLGKWLVSKGIWYVASIGAVLGIGSFFGVLPQSLKDMINWFSTNASELLLAGCVLVACYTIVHVTDRRGKTTHE